MKAIVVFLFVTIASMFALPYALHAQHAEAPVYKEGDSWVFRVKGSGEFDGENQIAFKNGQFESSSAGFLGTAVLVTVNLNDPERKWFDFPLASGKKWSFRYSHRNRAGKLEWRDSTAEVIGPTPQPLETAAGKVSAIEIRRADQGRARFVLTYFYSPDTKSVVKLVADVDSPGGKDHVELELIKYSVQ
ncbi:MAG: hypothetical protein HY695_25700 [Deltaproteobacteria bacterium]|nr:hypothetical protein [Deltaproteobacteria bacterium]